MAVYQHFHHFFLLQSKRTDKLSGTRDFIVNGWPAASIPSPHNCFGPHCIKQTAFTRQHRTIRILPCVQGSSMFLPLRTSTIVSNRIDEVRRPNKGPACPPPSRPHKKEVMQSKPISIWPWIHYYLLTNVLRNSAWERQSPNTCFRKPWFDNPNQSPRWQCTWS